MTPLKKLAKFGSATVASLAVAVTLLVGLPGIAHAAVSGVTPEAPIQTIGLTETWTISYTESGAVAMTTAAVTFPAGFTVPQGVIAGATAAGAAACTGVVATGAGQVVSFTMTSCATAAAATNKFVVPGVVNTMTPGTTGNFSVVTSASTTASTGAAVIGVRGFSGAKIADAGLSIVSFTGTTALLDAVGTSNNPKVITVSVTVDGKIITHVIGAPAFVNANFRAAFLRGLDATYMIVKTGN